MPDLLIQNARIVRPGQGITAGSVAIRAGRIVDKIDRGDAITIDGKGQLLTPGLIDLHTHGIHTYLYERSPEDIRHAAHVLPEYGTTTVLPTLYRVMNRPNLDHLAKLAVATTKVRGARMPGFHLEGPFLALPGAGAETIPGDVGLCKDLYAACDGRVVAMSISPDSANIIPVIEWLVAKGVVPLMTHTKASAEETDRAIAAGAVHATHFYDVFPVPPVTEGGVRPVGAVEAILADDRVSVDFICDGVHVHPTAIRAALAAKTYAGIVLITDSNIGAGLEPGEYDTPWGFSISVEEGDGARIADPSHQSFGGLAGSALTMNVGMRNLMNWLSIARDRIWAMGTSNVARLLKLEGLGVIELGAHADLVLWDEDLKPSVTIVGGEVVYQREVSRG